MTNIKYPPSPPPRPLYVQILRTVLLTFAWALAVLAGIGLLTFLIAFLSGLLAWLLPFAAILFLALLASIGRGRQRRRAVMILTYLEQSVRLNQPLPPMLRAAAAGESRRAARRLEDLAWAMSQGVSLGQALSLYTPEVSARSLTLIAAAERIGQLPATLHRLVQDDRAAVRRIDPTRVFYRWYPLLLLLAMSLLLSLLGIFIMPKFAVIFSDFNVPMPRLTVIVYALTRNAIPYVALALLLIILIFAGRRLWELRCGPRALPGRSIQDSFLWFFPLTRQAVTDRALADVCALAADALSLGRPLDRALDEAQGLDMNRILRRRIRAWNVHLHAGELPHTAAAHARLPRFFVGMLATAQAASNLPDVLSFLARYYAARFSRVLIFLQSAYTPIVVFIMALLVGAILLSVFLPIQRLIDAVAPSFGVF